MINDDENESNIEFIVDTIENHTLRLNAKNKDEKIENNANKNVEKNEIKKQTNFIQFETKDEVNSNSENDVQKQLNYYLIYEVIQIRNLKVI